MDKEMLLLRKTCEALVSVIFFSSEALAHTKWREALSCLVVCVRLLLMKPTACQNGKGNSI